MQGYECARRVGRGGGFLRWAALGLVGAASLSPMRAEAQSARPITGPERASLTAFCAGTPFFQPEFMAEEEIVTPPERQAHLVMVERLELPLRDRRSVVVSIFAIIRVADRDAFRARGVTIEDATRTVETAIRAAAPQELRRVDLRDLLSPGRRDIVRGVEASVAAAARPIGVEIVDMQFLDVALPRDQSRMTIDRMRAERQAVAAEVRAEGAMRAATIRARADRAAAEIEADLEVFAAERRAAADSEAAQITAAAYAADPEFFEHYRALRLAEDPAAPGDGE